MGADRAASARAQGCGTAAQDGDLCDVFDAILSMAATGCQWRMLPNDFPPVSTVRRSFYDWRDNGLLRKITHHLVRAARELEGREAPARRPG